MNLIVILGFVFVSSVAAEISVYNINTILPDSYIECTNRGKEIYQPSEGTFQTAGEVCGSDACWVGGYYSPKKNELKNDLGETLPNS